MVFAADHFFDSSFGLLTVVTGGLGHSTEKKATQKQNNIYEAGHYELTFNETLMECGYFKHFAIIGGKVLVQIFAGH